MRLILGFTGLATASAVGAAILVPPPTFQSGTTAVAAAVQPGQVVHVVRYVHLQPGQTPPPNAVVQQVPAPAPQVVTVTTRQSGAVK